MRNYRNLLIIMVAVASCKPAQPEKQLLVDEWKVEQLSGAEQDIDGSIAASVPGCIHLDLLDNGLIDDPFYGANERKLQWIGESSWAYSMVFAPGPGILEKENIELAFEGLDTYAEVYLNDSLVITADNMFRTWRAGVKGLLRAGENHLSVIFFPPGEINEQKASALPYALPDKRAFTRKAPYHFGWDWGPEYVTCGIWKPVGLYAWDDLRIERVHVEYASIDEDPLPLLVHADIRSSREQTARLRLFDDSNGSRMASGTAALKKGLNTVSIPAELHAPELWWPAGLGEQKLYTLRLRATAGGSTDEAVVRYGIREVKLVREPDEYGESFFFSVNGLPVFAKGANYIPQDNFLTRVDTVRYEKLIRSVAEANMNMLRVWGGGFYENDIFYDLCDEHGIMVWQDFMFACNMYPGDEAFLSNVRREAIDNVGRIANHPSVVVWCGNNEVDEGWHNWGWQDQLGYSYDDSAKIWNDYLKVFEGILPEVVAKYDPGTAYHPSSPATGWGREEAYTQGDVHYWGVWWGEEPFEMYRDRIGRFVSEYGFQGMPPVETIESFGGVDTRPKPVPSGVEGYRVPRPEILESHQKHPRGTELIRKYMERDFIVPERFGDYVYISQVLQAEGMGQGFFTHRIARPWCMGTLYWQLNDCWPVTSWSGLDYYGRWKALHYHVKRAYEPLMVRAVLVDSLLAVIAVNDHPEGKEILLKASLQHFDGSMVSHIEMKRELMPQGKEQLFSMPVDKDTCRNMVFVARLLIDGVEVSSSFLYFAPAKELELPDPELGWAVGEGAGGPVITLEARKLARQVFLEARGLDGHFSDNFFDMAAGEKRSITFKGEANAALLAEKLTIISIYDTLD
jgi:beta-mannosidase